MGDSLSEHEGVYHNVIETLFQTFGKVLSRDIICAIVENCSGDMDQSADAIMNITNDIELQPSSLRDEKNAEVQPSLDVNNIVRSDNSQNTISSNQNIKHFGVSQNIEQCSKLHSSKGWAENVASIASYSGAAQSVTRPSRITNNPIHAIPTSDLDFWTSQLKQILMNHNKGSRILIMMRGVPGSGKTYLAKKILEATIGGYVFDYKIHIFSSDDYFLINGLYRFDPTKLGDAHIWNQTKARSAMKQGLSPVIIDNTNIEPWEMEPYLRDGVSNGYLIEIVEPNTSWAKRANQLARKNTHGVPLHKIRRILDNFQSGLTVETLLKYYKLSYPKNLIPPILRNFPIVPIQMDPVEQSKQNAMVVTGVQHSEQDCKFIRQNVTVQNEEIMSNVPSSTCANAISGVQHSEHDSNSIRQNVTVQNEEIMSNVPGSTSANAVSGVQHSEQDCNSIRQNVTVKNEEIKSNVPGSTSANAVSTVQHSEQDCNSIRQNVTFQNEEIMSNVTSSTCANAISGVQHSEHDCNSIQENTTVQNEKVIFNLPGSTSANAISGAQHSKHDCNSIQENVSVKNEEIKSNVPDSTGANAVPGVQHLEQGFNNIWENVSVQNEEIMSHVSGSTSADEQMKDKTEMFDNSLNSKDENNERYQFDNNLEQCTEPNVQLEVLEQIDEAWEANQKWDDDSVRIERTCDENEINDSFKYSKPPRDKLNKFKRKLVDSKLDEENLLMKCQDWTKFDMFMQPWDNNVKSDEEKIVIAIEKVSSSTSVDLGDTDICNTNKAYKILHAVPRDINLYYMPLDKEKIPEKRMLDKSSMVNEQALAEAFKGGDEKEQFTIFTNIFKDIPKSKLKSVYDICCGDINWASCIVLDGIPNNEFMKVKSDDSSNSDEETPCLDEKTSKSCADSDSYDDSIPSTSANVKQISEDTINNITSPDNSKPSTSAKADQLIENKTENVPSTSRKSKKANTSQYVLNVQRQIERNIVISENHYSKHCLKIRNQRQGIRSEVTDVSENSEDVNRENIEIPGSGSQGPDEEPSTSNGHMEIYTNHSASNDFENESNSDDSDNDFSKHEETVNINLSWNFITKLDEYFGRDMVYPEHVTPVVNIPKSFLNEINVLWMESFMDQLQAKSKETQLMIEQDEEIARELEKKEFELHSAGEPEIPDFKALMDKELALSLYNKYTTEWRNNEPTDLAARLTREKLYNLFPDINKDVLAELLMAHNNNFYHTVEGLLLSTGQTEILARENGVSEFIIAKGTERREKLREEQKKVLSESEPLFLPRGGEKVDMQQVERYRKEASMHLARRNLLYNKVRDYMSQGKPQIASYYSEIAAMHTQKYEHANSLAAASLIQVGTHRSSYVAVIDFHFFRVREAMEGIDLFLDSNINALREKEKTSNVKYMTLYFITGRGLHSRGLPRIKPAVKRRLLQRSIAFKERNPGLLTAKVYAGHKMTHEVA